MRRFALKSIGLIGIAAVLSACSVSVNDDDDDGNGSTQLKSVSVDNVTASGEVRMSGSLQIVDGKLGITLAAIKDPENLAKPVDASKVKFVVTAQSATLNCGIQKVSASSKGSADIVFINDTTGSMSGTVNGIADSVAKFAQDVAGGGVDARFSMYTYGDAFATVAADRTFTVAKGDFAPPTIDDVDRPYVGLVDVTTFKSFLDEVRNPSIGILGEGGGDSPENTLGALKYANEHVAFRTGASHVFVAIGDNPSHQAGDGVADDFPETWRPPTGDALATDLSGGATVHVVGTTDEATGMYPLKSLADKTGGVFLELPSDGVVDLSALNLSDWLTTSFTGTCTDAKTGAYVLDIAATITGSKTYTGNLSFTLTVK